MSKPLFVCDDMLGRLARWLRIINCDTLYFNHIEDSYIAWIARTQNRVVLTRDTTLAKRKFIEKNILIISDDVTEQLRHVVNKCCLHVRKEELLSRCIICNLPIREIAKGNIKNNVPSYIYSAHEKFYYCYRCEKTYWQGTHYQRILEALGDLID